jgi:hypothetical protein
MGILGYLWPHLLSPSSPLRNQSPESAPSPERASNVVSSSSVRQSPEPEKASPGSQSDRETPVSKGVISARVSACEKIASMNQSQLLQFLGEALRDEFSFKLLRFDFQYAFQRLAEIAPTEGAELLVKSDFPFLGFSFFTHWAARDSERFLDWLRREPGANAPAARVVQNIASHSPELAAELAHQLKDLPHRVDGGNLMEGFLSEQNPLGKRGWKEGLNYIEKLPEGPVRDAALARLSVEKDFPLADRPDALQALARISGAEAWRAGGNLADKYQLLPPSEVRTVAIGRWIYYVADSGSDSDAAETLQRLTGPEYAAGVRGFIQSKAANEDPKAAAQWALSIPPELGNERLYALHDLLRKWSAQEPEEAAQWIQTAPVSDTEYFRLTGKKRSN